MPDWMLEIGLCSGVCGLIVATALSVLGRPVPAVLLATALGAIIPAGLLLASRAAFGPHASLAAPAAAALLTTLGVVTAERLDPGEGAGQSAAALLGAVGYVVVGAVATRQRGHRPAWAVPTLSGLACGLLLLPFVPGLARPTPSGVDLAIRVAGISVQPSEFARPLVVLALAIGIAQAGPCLRWARRPVVVAAAASAPLVAPVGLLVAAADFGPVLVLGGATVGLILLARPAWPVVAAVAVVPALLGLVAAATVPTIRDRFSELGGPDHPDGGLTHVGFGLRAFARGGWFGTGPGLGDPGAVRYAESDFVLAAVAEERGSLTVLIVLALFIALFSASWSSADRAAGEPARLAAAGLVALLVVQAVYTTLGVLGVVPLTGMAVPFVSLGGSALVAMWLTLGVVVGLGASASWPVALAPRGFAVARRATTAALLAGALLAVSVVVVPPVPPGRPPTADWAQRRGAVLAADGTVLATTSGDGRGAYRQYPAGDLFAGSVGFTTPGAGAGLEVTARDRYSCRDSLWQRVIGRPCTPPSVLTTLVPAVQQELAAALTPVTGDAVVLDITTGGVVAAYSTGGTDPARLVGDGASAAGTGRGSAYADLATSPGSVFKLVVAAAVLRSGLPSDTPRRTQYRPPGGTGVVSNAGDAPGGGSLETTLAASSNTAFAELGGRAGEARIADEVATLLDWAPVPDGPSATAATVGRGPLDPDGLARTGFGQQGVRATPLALAVLAAEIGSGGLQRPPRLVAGTCAGAFEADPLPAAGRVMAVTDAERLASAMERAVREGRAPALAGLGAPVAAKTGTAERPDGLYDGLVVAYAPADRPTVAIAVRVEADPATRTSRSGGTEAAAVAAAGLRAALGNRVPATSGC